MSCKYLKVAALSDLRDEEMFPVELEGEPILLAKVQGQVHAFHAICTHGLGYLEDGFLEGHEVSCPLHDGRFDIRDGQPTKTPCTEPIKCYPVRIEGNDVFLTMDAGDAA